MRGGSRGGLYKDAGARGGRGVEDAGREWLGVFVLIRQGLRGGSGPQRLIRALGEETGNPIMAFHRDSELGVPLKIYD